MKTIPKSERRHWQRLPLAIPVFVHGQDEHGNKFVEFATAMNISAGGVAIRTDAPLEHGAMLDLSFRLPDTETTIQAQARMAWSGPEGLVGLQFTEIHPALEIELHRWLFEKARKEGWVHTAEQRL